jgi:hypothetical protein
MRLQADFQVFLGIDQTGAVRPGSRGLRARPLHWAALEVGARQVRLVLPQTRLERFHLDSIEFGLDAARLASSSSPRIAVLLDCVLGLPLESLEWGAALDRLASEPEQFGRAPAQQFFSSLLGSDPRLPTRLCEEWAQANSVFREKPYQKNIQTGTFRLWRDLVSDPRREEWTIWPFDRSRGRFTLFEGYPSFLWRRVAGHPSRDPKSLGRWLTIAGISFTKADELRFSSDADLADSVMLAAAGWKLHAAGKLLEPFAGFFESEAFLSRGRREGWIAGLAEPQDRN